MTLNRKQTRVIRNFLKEALRVAFAAICFGKMKIMDREWQRKELLQKCRHQKRKPSGGGVE